MRVARDKVEVEMLIDIAKERERGRENKNAKSGNKTKEKNQDAFVPCRECF
jgi:hypothetical protein